MIKRTLLLIVGALVGGATVWFLMRPSPDLPSAPLNGSKQTEAHSRSAETNSRAEATELRREAKKRDEGDEAGKELLAEAADGVVVNLGKVEDIGRQTADLLKFRSELAGLRAIPVGERTAAQSRRLLELERQTATAMGLLPEIAGFQNSPDEYSRFFGSLIQDAAGLDDARASVVSDYMKGRGEAMVAGGLNAAKEPTDPDQQQKWESLRDAFNKDTAKGVAKLLPPGEAEKIGFTPEFLELLEQDFDKAE